MGHCVSKKRETNPNYVKIGRNEPCYCGSGKKFKKCCISKEYIEIDQPSKGRLMASGIWSILNSGYIISILKGTH
jgi:hypothetical protein